LVFLSKTQELFAYAIFFCYEQKNKPFTLFSKGFFHHFLLFQKNYLLGKEFCYFAYLVSIKILHSKNHRKVLWIFHKKRGIFFLSLKFFYIAKTDTTKNGPPDFFVLCMAIKKPSSRLLLK